MIALLEAKRQGLLAKKHWANNIVAGIVVGIVAIPLSMAFAISTGVKPEQGLYTALIAGGIVSIFGGSRYQIAGPTGAFVVILSSYLAQYGFAGLSIATILAGLILVLMGVFRLGTSLKYISPTVITGFTAGIALIIWVGQWKSFLGLTSPPEEDFAKMLLSLLQAIPSLHLPTTLLSLLSLAILLIVPKFTKKVPPSLIAIICVTSIQSLVQIEGVATIGSTFGAIAHALPHISIPSYPLGELPALIKPAIIIALLGGIESLLSTVVADSMTDTEHRPNQELIGQGLANIVSPLFGGIAATGAIARTATNIKNGATSPLAGITHTFIILFTLLFLTPYVEHIPLCALAAILCIVAYNMCQKDEVLFLLRNAPKEEIFILLVTFLLTVFTDLVLAVGVGVGLSALFFMVKMTSKVALSHNKTIEEDLLIKAENRPELKKVLEDFTVVSLKGPLFFATIHDIKSQLYTDFNNKKVYIIEIKRMPYIDMTGLVLLREFADFLEKRGQQVYFYRPQQSVKEVIKKTSLSLLLED